MPVQTWDLPIRCKQRICHGDARHAFSLCGRVLVREAEYYQTLFLVFLIQVVELWHFRHAGSAPGCPNIHEHDLTLMVAEALIVSVEITRLKGRRRNVVNSFVPHPNPEQNRSADEKYWDHERDCCKK